MNRFGIVVVIGALAGCGGSGTVSELDSATGQLDFLGRANDEFAMRSLTATDGMLTPRLPEGGAAYRGVAVFVVSENSILYSESPDLGVTAAALGVLEIDVDFDLPNLDGSVSNFVALADLSDLNNGDYASIDIGVTSSGYVSGELALTADTLGGPFQGAPMQVTGQLEFPDGAIYDVTMEGGPDFYGTDAEYVEIFAAGDLGADGFTTLNGIGEKLDAD